MPKIINSIPSIIARITMLPLIISSAAVPHDAKIETPGRIKINGTITKISPSIISIHLFIVVLEKSCSFKKIFIIKYAFLKGSNFFKVDFFYLSMVLLKLICDSLAIPLL